MARLEWEDVRYVNIVKIGCEMTDTGCLRHMTLYLGVCIMSHTHTHTHTLDHESDAQIDCQKK